jgi:hypothetical protein
MVGIGLDETAVHRHVLAPHQSGLDAAGDDLLKNLPKQIRFLESSMPVFGKRRVMRNLLVEAESREPTPRREAMLRELSASGALPKVKTFQRTHFLRDRERGVAKTYLLG